MCTDKLWDLEKVETYAGSKEDTIEIGARERARFCLFVQVCVRHHPCVCMCFRVCDVLLPAYFISPYSLSSDRSSKPPSKHLETGTRRGEREWMGKKESNAMGEKKDGAQRKGGQEKSSGRDRQTEQQRMEQHKTERTDERMEPNERRKSVGLRDEREGKATSSSPSPLLVPPLLPVRMPRVCIFFLVRSAALSFAHKDGT